MYVEKSISQEFPDAICLPDNFESNPFPIHTLVCKKMQKNYRYFISNLLICLEEINLDIYNEYDFLYEKQGLYYYKRSRSKKVALKWDWYKNFIIEYYTYMELVKYALFEPNLKNAEVHITIFPTRIYDHSKINIQITGEHQMFHPSLYHLTLTYQNDSETRQVCYPFLAQVIDTYPKYIQLFEPHTSLHTNIPSEFCGFIHGNTNCKTRNDFFHYLCQNYKKVNSYGKLFNNVGKIHANCWFDKEQIDLYRQNKFGLCFENSRDDRDYYITEKILNVKLSGAVPIYWGTSKCHEIFEKDSFLFLEDASEQSFQKLLKQIIELDNNDEKYLAMKNKPLLNPEKIKHFRMSSLTREF